MGDFQCKGKTWGDCFDCGMWYSKHSEHYDKVKKRKVTSVTCFQKGGYCGDFDAKTGERLD